jgi:undecaprenyl-diphosphatase
LTEFQAVVLSLVQALTEFLPVSSSGHLILVPYFLGWPDQGLSFDIATNTGTLLALLVYFRSDLIEVARGFFTGEKGHHDYDPRTLAWALIIGTIPAAIVGPLVHHRIESQARNPLLIATTATVYGLLLWFADRNAKEDRDLASIGWKDALIVGCAQALALVPGTSRSGITITAALFLGLGRSAAARFAFLLSVPLGILVAVYEAYKGGFARDQWTFNLIAIGVSAVAGYLVIGWFLNWLRRQRLTVFVVYRLLLAAVIVTVYFIRR